MRGCTSVSRTETLVEPVGKLRGCKEGEATGQPSEWPAFAGMLDNNQLLLSVQAK
jgi:hypothetical protein